MKATIQELIAILAIGAAVGIVVFIGTKLLPIWGEIQMRNAQQQGEKHG